MTSKRKSISKVEELKDALEKRKKSAKNVSTEKGKIEDGSSNLEHLTSQIKAAETEAKDHYDKLLRMMAELDNFKKRSEREKQEVVKYSNEQLVTDLLPALDDLDRVLEHVPEGASKELVDFVQGVQLVSKHFLGTLEKYGLKEIRSDGEKFNPECHEAVAHLPNPDIQADHVIEVHRKGYMLNERVIRAAMVSVSKGNE